MINHEIPFRDTAGKDTVIEREGVRKNPQMGKQ